MDEIECPTCGGATVYRHDCGEASCCCLMPEPNVTCPTCMGRGTVPATYDDSDHPEPEETR